MVFDEAFTPTPRHSNLMRQEKKKETGAVLV
jgi:hypothetical protein